MPKKLELWLRRSGVVSYELSEEADFCCCWHCSWRLITLSGLKLKLGEVRKIKSIKIELEES